MKKVLLLLLTACLLFGLTSVFAFSADTEAEPIVMDFSSSGKMLKNKIFYLATNPDKPEWGIVSLDREFKAMKVEYAGYDWKGSYRFMVGYSDKNRLPQEYRYVQLTFMAECDGYYTVSLHHNAIPGASIELCDGFDAKAGEWYTTAPVKLNDQMWTRLNTSHITIGVETSEKEGVFYFRSLTFLPSEVVEGAAEDTPIVIDLSSSRGMMRSNAEQLNISSAISATESGICAFDDDEKAIRLSYTDDGNWKGDYRTMVQFLSPNYLPADYRYVRLVYKASFAGDYTFNLYHNGNMGATLRLCDGIGKKANEWYTTELVELTDVMWTRINTTLFTIGAEMEVPKKDGVFYIRALEFFSSPEQAANWTGISDSEEKVLDTSYIKQSLGGGASILKPYNSTHYTYVDANGVQHSDMGFFEYDETKDATQLLYAPGQDADGNTVDYMRGNYRCMPFLDETMRKDLLSTYCYARVEYMAKNPEGETDAVKLIWRNNGNWNGDNYTLVSDVRDTEGAFVLSDVVRLSSGVMTRLQSGGNLTLYFDASNPGGEYYVKNIYFFQDPDAADLFTPDAAKLEISLGGTDISEYRIVIGDERNREYAEKLQAHIRSLCGASLDLVTADAEETKYEILIGDTGRKESDRYYATNTGSFMTGEHTFNNYFIAMDGSKFVFAGGTYLTVDFAILNFLTTRFGQGWRVLPESFEFESDYLIEEVFGDIGLDPWPTGIIEETVLEEPIVYVDDFEDEEEEPDYWIETVLQDLWKVKTVDENKVYAVSATDFTVSWLHVFECNTDLRFRFCADALNENGKIGAYTRYTYPTAYLAVGYDTELGAWYLETREGNIFMPRVLDFCEAELAEGEWYDVRVVAEDSAVRVYLNGAEEPILESDQIGQLTAGRVALFAQNAEVVFDDIDLTLLSGQGRLQDGVLDLALGFYPDGSAIEDKSWSGATYLEKENGDLLCLLGSSEQYVSHDDGLTWERTEFYRFKELPSIVRLQSGALLQRSIVNVGGKEMYVALYSDDDGETWEERGIICARDYKGYGTMMGLNMNDKIWQMSDGRVFVSQNYQGSLPDRSLVTMVEIYYSDDEGKTWTKSEMDSFDVTPLAYFGESQILESDDGRLLWVAGWNSTSRMLYAYSEDNGVTWGQMQPNHVTVSQSSSVIVRDPYAEELTYYMLFVFNEEASARVGLSRSRLALARSHDGVNWEYLTDVDRWESPVLYQNAVLNHYVNPAIYVTEDYVFVTSARSTQPLVFPGVSGHHYQAQFARRIEKDALQAYDVWPNTILAPVME